MTTQATLTLGEQEQILNYEDAASGKIVSSAQSGAINTNQFVFFAAFDGTNNALNPNPDLNTNVGSLWDQYQPLTLSSTNLSNGVNKYGGGYYAGPGTDGKLPGSSFFPPATTAQAVATANQAYDDFCEQAAKYLAANPTGTVSASLASFSRGDAAAAIFSQMLYDRGVVYDGQLLVPPGQVQVSGGVLFDPVTTGDSGNLAFAPIDKDFVDIVAQNEYRYQFESTSYASQSNFITTVPSYGAHSDVGGGYSAVEGAKTGIGYLTWQAAAQFLQNSGLSELADVTDEVVLPSDIVIHNENVIEGTVVPWPEYGQFSFSDQTLRRIDTSATVTPAVTLNGSTTFTLQNGTTDIITALAGRGTGAERVEDDIPQQPGANPAYTSLTQINEIKDYINPTNATYATTVADDTTFYISGNNASISSQIFVNNDAELINVGNYSQSTLTVGAANGFNLTTDNVTIETGNSSTGLNVLSGGTASSSSNLTWTDSNGNKYTFTPVAPGTFNTGTLFVSYGGNQLQINNFNLNAAETTSGYLGISFQEQTAIVAAATNTANPFATGSSVPTNVTLSDQGDSQAVTFYASGASTTAQTIVVTATGSNLANDFLQTGSSQISLANGPIDLTIAAGQNSVTADLLVEGTSSTAQTVALTSDIQQTGSGFASPVSNSLNVSFAATTTTVPAPTVITSTSKLEIYFLTVSTIVSSSVQTITVGGRGYSVPANSSSIVVGIENAGIVTQAQPVTVTASESVNGTVLNNTYNFSFSTQPLTNFPSGSNNTAANGYGLVGNSLAASIYSLDGGTDQVTTDSGVNLVIGVSNANNNTINGGNGQDIITLGKGNNQIYAGPTVTVSQAITQAVTAKPTNAKGDFIGVGDGNNTIVGSNGNDGINVGTGNNIIVFGAGQDSFIGGVETSGADVDWATLPMTPTTLNNGVAANVIQYLDAYYAPATYTAPTGYEGSWVDVSGVLIPVGTGNDTIYGGTGNSIFWLPNGNNFINAGGGNDTIQASTGNNTIEGGAGNDTISGGGGNDIINSGNGNDLIAGQGGNVTVYGGSGNDTILSGDASSALVNGLPTWATSQTGTGYLVAGSGNTQLYGAGGNDTLIGGSGNTSLYGGAGNELLQAGSGTTTMLGGAGNDTLIGASGNATLQAGSGTTYITAGAGVTSIFGGTGNDTLIGGAANDTISGGSGNESIVAGTGNTSINGGAGSETINGGDGNDTIYAGAGTNLIYAGDGGTSGAATYIQAGIGSTTIYGGAGVDNIFTGAGDDVIYAGAGGTTATPTFITVGSGNSTIYAGSGVDYIDATSGTATYIVNSNVGSVTIANSTSNDSLQFGTGITIANITASETTYSNGIGYTLTLSQGGIVTVNLGSMTQVSFADGSTATLAQLASPTFTVGSTTYSSVSTTLPQDNSQSNSQNVASGMVSMSRTMALSTTTQDQTTSLPVQSLTLLGNGDLVGTGNNDDDVIQANNGSDTLIAGTANDTLIGGGVSDNYVVGAGSGTTTTINNSTANDVLTFGSGIGLSNLSVSASSGSNGVSVITIQNNQGGSVVINGSFGQMVDQLSFADGSTASLGQLLAPLTTGSSASTSVSSVVLPETVLNMTLTGTGNISATANDLANVITANIGNDTLIAGTANDTLVGGGGVASYVVNSGSGNVTIQNSGAADTLVFGAGISEQNLITTSAVVNGVNVVTIENTQGNVVTIDGGNLDSVTFADGNVATLSQLLSPTFTLGNTTYSNISATLGAGISNLDMTGFASVTATGNSLNDVIQSNFGNDTLIAGSGSDTLDGGFGTTNYVVGSGTQVTTINQSNASDTLSFGVGVTVANLSVNTTFASDGTAVVTITNNLGGTIVINGGLGQIVDQLSFANGSSASLGQLLAQQSSGPTAATSSVSVGLSESTLNMTLTGTGNISATGNDLEDVMTANSGNDTLIAGTANDTLVGGGGIATYDIANYGSNVTVLNSAASDTLIFGAGVLEQNLTTTSAVVNGVTVVTIANDQGGSVTIQGGGLTKVSFADGNTATLAQLLSPTYTLGTTTFSTASTSAGTGVTTLVMAGNANVTAADNTLNDLIEANNGNDTLIANNGNDTLVGSAGSTTYQIGAGIQTTTINQSSISDTLSFAAGISLTNINVDANLNGTDVLTLKDSSGGTVIINGYLGSMVDTINFAGNMSSISQLLAPLATGPTAATSATSVVLPENILNMTLTGTDNLTASANYLSNVITANTGNDTLIAGSGSDTFIGDGGVVNYDVNANYSNVTIENSGASDLLVLGAGIQEQNISAISSVLNGVSGVSIVDSLGGNIRIQGGNLTDVRFSDGQTFTLAQLESIESSSVSTTAASGVTTLNMTGKNNVTATANSLNDVINANSGNDILNAGSGYDTLNAGAGNDTLNAGSGPVTMNSGNLSGTGINSTTFNVGTTNTDVNINAGSNDVLQLAPSVDLSSLIITQVSGGWNFSASNLNLVTVNGQIGFIGLSDGSIISLAGYISGDYVDGVNQYSSMSTTVAAGVTNLALGGTRNLTATANNLNDVIMANSGTDILIAGIGSDTLIGNGGVVSYDINANATNVAIENSGAADTVVFGAGILASNITVQNYGDQDVITDGLGGSITIEGALTNISFTGGNTYTLSELLASMYSSVSATAGSGVTKLTMTGGANVTATANALNDVITANSGNDSLIAGTGNDTLTAGSGNDTLVAGSGAVSMIGGNQSGTGENVTTYQVGASNTNVLINVGSSTTDALQLGSTVSVTGLEIVQIAGGWTISSSNMNPVTINGQLGSIILPDGTVTPFATLLNGTFTDGTTEFSSAFTTLPSGESTLDFTGSANVTGVLTNNNDTLTGNNGNDSLTIGAGTSGDVIYAGSGNDTLTNNSIYAGNTLISGNLSGLGKGSTTFIDAAQGGNYYVGPNDTIQFAANNVATLRVASAYTGDDGTGTRYTEIGQPNVNTIYVYGTPENIELSDGVIIPWVSFLAGSYVDGNTQYTTTSATLAPTLTNLTLTEEYVTYSSFTLTANNLNDVLSDYSNGDDTLCGGSGNDTLISAFGDSLVGGTGNTTFEYAYFNSSVTISQSSTNETLLLGSANGEATSSYWMMQAENEYTNPTARLLSNGTTDIEVCGVNIQVGPNGYLNQINFTDGSGLTVDQLLQADPLNDVSAAVNTIMAVNDVELTLTGSGNLSATGNMLDDIITANSGSDTLIAGSGSDTLISGAGNDTLMGGSGNDIFQFGAGQTTIIGSTVSDVLNFNNIVPSSITATSVTTNGTTVVTLTSSQYGAVVVDGGTAVASFGSSGVFTLNQLLGGAPVSVTSAVSTTMAAGVSDLTLTGTANLTATGNNLNDVITANSGNDSLIAGTGVDTLVAGAGNDTLVSGAGINSLVGGTGNDTFVVNNTGDVISQATLNTASVEISSVTATLAANLTQMIGEQGQAGYSTVLTGNNLSDVIAADGSNETLIAGSGVDTLVGDTVSGSVTTFDINNAGDVIVANALSYGNENTSVSTTAAANVTALSDNGAGHLMLVANNLDDEIDAGNNDTLVSGAGNDTLNTYQYASLNTTMIGGNGGSTFYSYSNMAGGYGIPVNAISDQLTVLNSQSSDILDVNLMDSSFVAGTSTIVNGVVDDSLFFNNGGWINVNGGALTQVEGFANGVTTISQLLAQTAATDSSTSVVMTASSGVNLVLTGNANLSATAYGADVITANSGSDTLQGGSGDATLVGGSGNDTFIVGSTDYIDEGVNSGNNTEEVGSSTTLNANIQNLMGTGTSGITLTGNALNNVITANTGADKLIAGSGNDTLISGTGKDTLTGGTGNDLFEINNASDSILVSISKAGNVVQSTVNYVLPTNLLNLTGTGTTSISLTGNTLANTITANSANDTLVAGAGVATLVGGAGNDTFVLNNTGDVISEVANTGNNTEQTSFTTTLVANVQNLTGTGSGALALTGNTLANIITANTGADTLIAGSGVATLKGGTGNDTFVINNSGDVITKAASEGTANIEQTSVSATLAANVQFLTGTGSNAITLTGSTTANTITANSAADTLIAGTGVTTMIGGTGNDTFEINSASDVIIEAANTGNNTEQATVTTTLAANVQNLTGTSTGSISLTGNGLANTITANSGTDTLIAGAGVATLVGGTGNDTFEINNVNDVITEAANTGTNTEDSTVSTTLAANVQKLTGTSTGAITLTGNSLANTITANSGADTLIAGSGLATLVGGTGNDTFVINSASDVITKAASEGTANIEQTSVSATLAANVQYLAGTGSNAITLTGSTTANTITANSAADTLIAGTGITTMIGGTGNDTFEINNASDVITEAANTGNNTEQTSVTATLASNVQNLTGTGSTAITLTGNTLNNTITANTAADKLIAGNGNDTLISGTAIDSLTGGTGSDTFVVNNASDVITASSSAALNAIDTTVSYTASANVQDLVVTGTGSITATGNTTSDLIVGGSGNDSLVAGTGAAVIEAGTGATTLKDTASANALIAGSGNDTMTGGTGVSFMAAGVGTDTITLGAGVAVVADNSGDGAITIAPGTGTVNTDDNTLSLGGGIAYANLTFTKSGNNLILNAGGTNSITFTNWYAGAAGDQSFVNLQVIEQAASTYSSSSSNTLYSSEVETFNLTTLVSQFNTAGQTSGWSLMNDLLTDHLNSSNTAALGGDLGYYDGLNGNLTGMNLATAISTLQNASFGKTAQTMDAWSGISTGNNKLH